MEKTTIFTCDSIGVSGTTPVQKGREIKARESRALAAEHELTKLQTEVEQLQAELKNMTTQRNVWMTDEQSRCRDVAILQTENDELTMAVAEYTVMSEALKDEMQVSKRLMDALENITDADAICASRLVEIIINIAQQAIKGESDES